MGFKKPRFEAAKTIPGTRAAGEGRSFTRSAEPGDLPAYEYGSNKAHGSAAHVSWGLFGRTQERILTARKSSKEKGTSRARI
jgi:hypothetical protein